MRFLVTVGTDRFPMNRLMDALDVWQERLPGEWLIQHGASKPPKLGQSAPMFPYHELMRHMDQADVIITHGGAGSMLSAIARHKKPWVLCRVKSFGEAVDDHQVELANALHRLGFVHQLTDLAKPDFRPSPLPLVQSSEHQRLIEALAGC